MMKEKKLKNSVESVSISCTKTILEQMMNCICNIKLKGSTGTGFFCKLPNGFGNNETFDCLLTNYHNINEKYVKENKEIDLLLKDNKEPKFIDLLQKREKYFNKDYDITIIEILKSDKIKKFLELDEDIFKENNKISYEDESIYILQHQKGKNASVSYGLLLNIDKFDIKHSCNTDFGSSGSPILNLSNNKVIGIHKEGSPNFNFNKGTFLKFPLNDFLLKLNLKKPRINKDSIPINNSNENNFFMERYKKFNQIISLYEIEGELNNEIMEIFEDIKSDYENNFNENDFSDNLSFRQDLYLNAEFSSIIKKIRLLSAYLQSSSYEINKYKKKLIKNYKLFSKIFNFIKEIYKSKYYDVSSIENIKNFTEEEINRIENSSSSYKSKIVLIFGYDTCLKFKLAVDYGTSVEHIIKKFFILIDKPDFINRKEILLIYNAKRMKIGDKTKVEDYFENSGETNKIFIYDVKGLIF